MLATSLATFWYSRGYGGEGRRWLLDALALGGKQPPGSRAKALNRAGELSLRQGLRADARLLLEESMALNTHTPDSKTHATGILTIGQLTFEEGDIEEALALFKRAAATYQTLGDRDGVATTLSSVGYARLTLGDYAVAAADCAEAVTLHVELGNRRLVCSSLLTLGFALLELGDQSEAAVKIGEGLAIARELGFKEVLAEGLVAFATVAARQDDHERAARLLGAHKTLHDPLETVLGPFELAAHDRVLASVTQALDEQTLATAWAEGRALDLEQALDYALDRSPASPRA
jgi:tetratricopeptide (TPR) repeat protein